MTRHSLLALSALLACLSLPAAAEAAFAVDGTPQVPATYTAGMHALDDQRWSDAVASFDRVIAARDHRADAATYWKAYALNRLNKPALVTATCSQLHATYPGSSWNRDCSALQLQQQLTQTTLPNTADLEKMTAQATAQVQAQMEELHLQSSNLRPDALRTDTSHNDPDVDIKLLALNSLMNRDPAQAIPLLRGILTGNQPTTVKDHALFTLAQSSSPEAQSLLNDLVTGRVDPPLQEKAIQMAGVFQGKRSADTLAQVYRSTSDPRIKRSVVSALFVSGNAPVMVDLARSEKNLDLKRNLVSQLALMQDKVATDYMLELLK